MRCVQYLAVAFDCEGPWFTSIQEDDCDKGAHQSYLGAERNTPVIPNWFQLCQCCCCLYYPGEYLWRGTHISYNWAQVIEACDCLKLLSIHFDLCVDATAVVCHQLGLLSTDLRAVSCYIVLSWYLVVVSFFSLAGIFGEFSTIHSSPALFVFLGGD